MTEAQSGEYVCKVSNYIGEANQSAWLTVTRPVAKGNGELEGPLCWGLMEAPSCQGSCGEASEALQDIVLSLSQSPQLTWAAGMCRA